MMLLFCSFVSPFINFHLIYIILKKNNMRETTGLQYDKRIINNMPLWFQCLISIISKAPTLFNLAFTGYFNHSLNCKSYKVTELFLYFPYFQGKKKKSVLYWVNQNNFHLDLKQQIIQCLKFFQGKQPQANNIFFTFTFIFNIFCILFTLSTWFLLSPIFYCSFS